jgi:hypothetical protein
MASPGTSANDYNVKTVTIASGSTTSTVIDMAGNGLTAIEIASTSLDSATKLTVYGTTQGDSATFRPAFWSDGTEAEIIVPTDLSGGAYIPINPTGGVGFRWLKLVADTTQTADRTIYVATKPYTGR